MSEKIYVRIVETWTVSAASKPIEISMEALRKCEPPYEGNSYEDLARYLYDNVYQNDDFYNNETNKQVYGEEAVFDLCMEEAYDLEEFFDSRNKGEQSGIQVGAPNSEWTKSGGFEVKADSSDTDNW